MKLLEFDPKVSFLKLPIVWGTFTVITSLSCLIAGIIGLQSDLHFDLTYKGFNNFIEIFKLPITIWAINIPVIAVFAANHRSVQTKKQINVGEQQINNAIEQIKATEKQNIFSNYYKHIEEFEKYCGHHLRERPDIHASLISVRATHRMLFPDAIEGGLSINENILSSIDRTFMRVHDCIADFTKETSMELTQTLLSIDGFLTAEDRRFGINWIYRHYRDPIKIGNNKLIFYGTAGTLREFFLFIRWKAELIKLILDFDLTHRKMPELDKLLHLDHRRINHMCIEEGMRVKLSNVYLNEQSTLERIDERLYTAL